MEKIAIIGLSGAFPGAKNISELWKMLCRREEGLAEIDPAALLAAGVSREEIENPNYVAKGGFLAEGDLFDNDFFEMSPGEALVTDVQQRVFLTHSYLALEDAGYEPGKIKAPVGVFAGEGVTQYWFLLRDGHAPEGIEDFRQSIGNNKDFIATRVSYKMDLKGPSMNVQTGCSTGLTAVGLACQSLLTWGCDMALAGAVSIGASRNQGYTFVDGLIASKSGKCMPFDARADGTIASEGVGVVCLKRLSEALKDGDYIYAVLDSVAINNDGSEKVGYTAPSYKGQSEAIELAHALADVRPEDIGFVETHGTATYIGDPIEFQALAHAFRKSSIMEPYCYLGSIKSNIGHTDAAAGIVSLIKTALVVNTGLIPPLMHFQTGNPQLALETSKFRINTETVSWPLANDRRVAGLSSFGIGGTNVHAIVESPPVRQKAGPPLSERILLLSAKSQESLEKARQEMASFLEANPDIPLDDIIRKKNRSRHAYRLRWGSPARDKLRLIQALKGESRTSDSKANENRVFVFPGQGSQFSGMAAKYYGALPVFSQWIDKGLELAEKIGLGGLRSYLFEEGHEEAISQTEVTQPLLFIVEYALARELMSRGVVPTAVAGHSIGEYSAAAIAGVFSFEDGFSLVVRRGYWMQHAPAGAMTAVSAPLDRIESLLVEGVYVSVRNSREQVVLSGGIDSIERLEGALGGESIRFKRLKTSRAFHSPLMDGILDSFEEDVIRVGFKKATIPFLSNLDGAWIPETVEWTSYWRNQLRNPVRFDECAKSIAALGASTVFEAGPGRVLSSFIEAEAGRDAATIQFLPNGHADDEYFDAALVKAWERGCPVSWSADRSAPTSLVLAPGYAFSGRKFWPENHSSASRERVPAPVAHVLPAPDPAYESAKAEEEPSLDKEVERIWRATLGGAELGSGGDFFDAGGDSLIAVQLVQAVRTRFKSNIPVSDFLRKPSLAALIDLVASGKANPGDAAVIRPRADRRRAPLSSQQERLWFLHELSPDKPLYNLIQLVKIEGPCDTARLRQAMNKAFGRHDLFRAFIETSDGIPFMSFVDEARVPIEEIDRADMDADSAREALDLYIRDLARKPMDFARYPVCRAAIFRRPGESSYVCLLVPHIFSDGWSSDIFFNEIRDFYLHAGDESWAPPALSLDYGDYAAWERGQAKTEPGSESVIAFWKGYLKGIPEAHDLPLDHQRPKESSGRGSALKFGLDQELSARIHALCEAHSITPYMFFLACLAFLVRKHSSQETVVIGAPYANREREELRGLFGYFIRTIPLRFDVDEGSTAAAFLDYVKDQFLSAWEHSSIGLDELVNILSVPRTTNINPIYQIMFSFQSFAARGNGGQGEDGALFTQPFFDRGVSENDISLYMGESDRFEGTFEYAEDLFDAGSMEAFVANFKRVARALAEGFEGKLEGLSLMDDAAQELCDRTNRTEEPAYLGRSFLDLFAESLESFRDQIAVRSEGGVLTYGDLDRLSDGIARRLVASGAAPGDHVGAYLNRDRWLVPSLIGIFKAGAAYVPLDPHFPRDRLAGIAADAGIRMILTTSPLEAQASSLGSEFHPLSVDTGAVPSGIALPTLRPDQTAYILFTSGSTGKPKGVPILHSALANLLQSMRSRPGISRSDRVLGLTTFTFDISTLEFFLPLTCGALLVLADYATALDTRRLVSLIEGEGITYIQATPSRWTILLETGWKPRPGMVFLTGGEALPKKLAKSLVETGAKVWNMYGPTETTVWSSIHRVEIDEEVPSIGKPIGNTGFFVLDRRDNPLPAGIPGELGISGSGLSEGYLNRADLSASRFVHIDDAGTLRRVYKTGDLVRQQPSGDFRYFGRNDFQVKIRGFRIELGEIENAIVKFPGIAEAVCTVWERSESDRRIVAYCRSDVRIDEGSLNGLLKSSLPDYMIPSHFVVLDEFPRTSSGKIDRKALPLPLDSAVVGTARVKCPPRNLMQSRLQEIWQHVLEQDGFGVSESFFDLGGHSLLATRLITDMNEQLGNSWMLRDLFEHPTIEGLSSLTSTSQRQQIPLVFAAQKAGDKTPFFLASGVYDVGYHVGDGETAWERDFYRYFSTIIGIVGKDRPIYALRPRGIFKGERFRPSVEAMAKEYIDEIKLVQNKGPYIIGGECLGGNIAYEIAQRLLARGDKVKLILLDTDRGGTWSETKYRIGESIRGQKRGIWDLARSLRRSANRSERAMAELAKMRKILVPVSSADREFRRFEEGSLTLARRLTRYRPKRYPGEVSLFINEGWNRARPNLGWDSLICPNLTIRVVPGDHSTRLSVHGEVFARMLQDRLDG